jgi:hypothetical protein
MLIVTGISGPSVIRIRTAVELEAPFTYNGKPVSALGYRLYKLREQIEASAQRGEVKLLNQCFRASGSLPEGCISRFPLQRAVIQFEIARGYLGG